MFPRRSLLFMGDEESSAAVGSLELDSAPFTEEQRQWLTKLSKWALNPRSTPDLPADGDLGLQVLVSIVVVFSRYEYRAGCYYNAMNNVSVLHVFHVGQSVLNWCLYSILVVGRRTDMTDGCVHEHFLTFIQAESLDAKSLSSYIKRLITEYDFDTNKMVSQGYDGASVMSGCCTGVQTRVREFAPYAVYIHCYAHVLNLVLVDSVKSVTSASEFFMLLEALYVLVSSSKIHVLFMKKQHQCNPHKQPLELQKLSDTRWVCRYAAVNAVCRTYDSLVLTIEEVAQSSISEYSQVVEARGLCHQIKSFSFIVSLITFDRILMCTKQLSDQLQSSSIDLSKANELVVSTKSLLSHYRSDEYWEKVYSYALQVAELHNIVVEVSTRKRKRPARLTENAVVYDSIGIRETPSTKEEFKTQLFYPVLDQFLHELNNRFHEQNSAILNGISACTPSNSNFLCLDDLEAFAEKYDIAATSLQVEVDLIKQRLTTDDSLAMFFKYLHSCQPAYSTLYHLTQIALTIAVTSVEAERSFSALKRIKTRLRSTMAQSRLSSLAVLSIEREIAQKIDHDDVIDEFASSDKNRRIVLY